MHLNPHLPMDSGLVGWLFLLTLLGVIITFVCGIVFCGLFFDGNIDDDDYDGQIIVRNLFFGAIISLLGTAAIATAAFTGLNSNNDTWYNALKAQAQQRYGLALNRTQVGELLTTANTDSIEQGETLVILNAQAGAASAEQVKLFHIGDTWLLGTGSSYTAVQEISQIKR